MAFTMATSAFILSLKSTPGKRHNPLTKLPKDYHKLVISNSSSSSRFFIRRSRIKSIVAASAYVTGPAIDAFVNGNEPNIEESDGGGGVQVVHQPVDVISLGLLWRLVSRHKLRLLVSAFSLVGCTTCMLSLPILSGRFFEVLVGRSKQPLWDVLSKTGALYTLEPIFTILYVVNMNAIWEKVMTSLRAQIFQRVLVHKMAFFDRHKVGELTALLTSDLGSLKNIVSENTSRDRGFRALSEASYSTLSKSHWDNVFAVCPVPAARTNFRCTHAYCLGFSW